MPGQLVEWPLRCGPVPPLADASRPRPETGLGLVGKLAPGDTLILTPADQPGTHSYSISPNGRYAVHTWSSFGTPPRVELITLPRRSASRSL